MNVLAALLAVQVYLLSVELTGNRRLARILWFLASFTSPLLLYSSQIYPEIPSALLLIVAYRLITEPGERNATASLLLAACLAFLPWSQQRMIVPTATLLFYDLVRRRKSLASAAVPVVFVFLSAAGMAFFFYSLYGDPLPSAPYARAGITKVFSPRIFLEQGFLGLMIDQEAGLLVTSPWYVFLFPGALLLARRRPAEAAWLAALVLCIYVPAAGFTLKWYGAWSPAARYMVELVPFFLVFLCEGLPRTARGGSRTALWFLGLIALCWSCLFLVDPSASVMTGAGANGFLRAQSTVVDFTRYLPTFTAPSARSFALAGLWLAGIGLFTWWVVRTRAREAVATTATSGPGATETAPWIRRA